MSARPMVLPAPDGRWEVIEGASVTAVCDASEKARRVAGALTCEREGVLALRARAEELGREIGDIAMDLMTVGEDDLPSMRARVEDARADAMGLRAAAERLATAMGHAPPTGQLVLALEI